ncbi:hypothetical protein EJB05_44813 [Eragrostis curvula]|uniref:RING-type E3 ubiquitin transferase n=1 Tax=Eragrostis curvula TaxID=38414 RepID=A0A5J9TIR0_9POAL|nr:hypothetical protein EJB05_44813 [Eragrostis curvula]
MGTDNEEATCTSRHISHPKVHGSMCSDLSMMLDKVSYILPSIEAAQPGCKAGIEELCNLYNIVDKGKLIIQNCMECSSLYLAITCEATLMRCERIKNALRRSLFLIQNMVEPLLANQVIVSDRLASVAESKFLVADVHNDLGGVKFIVDPAEEEAGKVLLEMLRQSEATQEHELQTFLLAASKLKLTSPKAILMERRSIKKLLDKISGTDPKKEAILKYFLYLVRKYGKDIKQDNGAKKLSQTVNASNESLSAGLDVSGISIHQRTLTPTNPGNGRCEDVNGMSIPQRTLSHTNSSNVRNKRQNNLLGAAIPPLELCCPMSMTLMHDPVIIATGQTYERENIERWFNEGNDTCPSTQLKLQSFTVTPNTCMKVVICNWLKDHGLECNYLPEKYQSCSVSSLNNVSAPLITKKNRDYMVDYSSSSFGLSGVCYASSPLREAEQSKASFDRFYSNANYQLFISFRNFDKAMFLDFFHDLSELPMELQSKAVKDLKNVLNCENQIWHSMVSNGFLGAFHEFVKNDSGIYTVQGLKAGVQFLLAFLSSGRTDIPLISEDMVRLIASFLDSELKMEALLILHELFQQTSCENYTAMASAVVPTVLGTLDNGDTKCLDLELALKIICKISFDNNIKSYLVSAGVISKLSPLQADGRFTECCLNILRNLSEVKEASELIIRTGQCLSFISDHLDTGSFNGREHAVVILLAICSHSVGVCSLVMKEGVIPALVDLSVNGTKVAKDCSSKLLQLLRDFRRYDQLRSSCSQEVATNVTDNTPNGSICKQPISKSARYISRKLNMFSKPRSLTFV